MNILVHPDVDTIIWKLVLRLRYQNLYKTEPWYRHYVDHINWLRIFRRNILDDHQPIDEKGIMMLIKNSHKNVIIK